MLAARMAREKPRWGWSVFSKMRALRHRILTWKWLSKLSWCMDCAVFSIVSSARVWLPWRIRNSVERNDINGEISLSGR